MSFIAGNFCHYRKVTRASHTTETTEMLSDMLLKKCLEEKILLPGVSIFQRFISKIVEQAED